MSKDVDVPDSASGVAADATANILLYHYLLNWFKILEIKTEK